MVDGLTVQNKISSILTRADLTKTAEIVHFVVEDNDYGEGDKRFDYQETVSGVVLNYREFGKRHDPAGLFKESNLIFLLPATTSLNPDKDIIFIFDDYYDIIDITTPASVGEYKPLKRVFLKVNNQNLMD